ncbi:MAG: class I SAM-dependent methyltransferase, partial [Methanosarcinaceae archaeon]|nr:class I SAM-dependent methyltransferase [Methanosarcinaceae archaeon]
MSASNWEKIKGKKIPSSLELDPIVHAYLGKKNEILDIGCGPGKISLRLASLGHSVWGIDLNGEGIEIAKTFAEEADLEERLEFRVGDATALPYASEKFDLVLMQAFLTTVPGPEPRAKAVREAFRVLKPGGSLYISEFGQSWHLELYRKRYLRDFPVTKEEGSFLARDPETG